MHCHVLARGTRHTQVELLAAQLDEFFGECLGTHVTHLGGIHHITCLLTKAVAIGILAAARRNASRATSSLTPSIS